MKIIDFQSIYDKIDKMGDFSEAIFEKKLLELRDSQKEIQTLSQFCVHFRQHSKIVVKVDITLTFLKFIIFVLYYSCFEF